jgi:hypothetical protein
MTRMNKGADMQSAEIGGGTYGIGGTATATSTTSLTGTASPFVASAYIGQIVSAEVAYGVITANTTSVLTVDQWYNPASPNTTPGTTPSTTAKFSILPGAAPAMFMGIAATGARMPVVTDTTLLNEGSTAGSGMLRKPGTYAHTTSATNYTMSNTWTYTSTDNGTTRSYDTIGLFNTVTPVTGIMQFQTTMNAPASLSITGDAVTVTQTVTE